MEGGDDGEGRATIATGKVAPMAWRWLPVSSVISSGIGVRKKKNQGYFCLRRYFSEDVLVEDGILAKPN